MSLKRTSGFLFHWVLPLLVLGGTALSVFMLGATSKPNKKKRPPQVSVPVEVIRAKLHEGPLRISATGTVVPFREVDLAAEVGGRVAWKSDLLLPGTYVNKGEELLKIDPVDYELDVAHLKQQVAKADSDLTRVLVDQQNEQRLIELAQRTVKLRTRELDRIKSLQRSRATSDTEYDAAEKNFLEATQQATAHQNQLRALTAESKSLTAAKELAAIGLDKAKRDLARTTITAPFSGVVITHMAEANAHVQSGQTIARIEDTSQVEVRCNLRREDLDFLPVVRDAVQSTELADAYRLPPIPVTIHYSRAGRNYAWQGILSRQDGLGMDERTRTMPVRILVDDPQACEVDTAGGAVRPIALVRGMFVRVDLHCTPDRPLLAIPENTIRPGKTLWLVKDEQLAVQPIHIVRIENGIAYVDARGQLTRQDTIISSPVPGAKAGLAVTASGSSQAVAGGRGKGRPGADRPNARGGRKGNGPPEQEAAAKVQLAEDET